MEHVNFFNNTRINRIRNNDEYYERNNIELIDNQRFSNMIVSLDDVFTKKKLKKIYFDKNNHLNTPFFDNLQQTNINKPVGLWYSCGVDWYNWCYTHFPKKISNKRVFTFTIDYSNIIKISSAKELLAFHNKFSYFYKNNTNYKIIDWKLVAEHYDGIEICPFFKKYMFEFPSKKKFIHHSLLNSWYGLWSVASGCIWNSNAINNVIFGGLIPKINENKKLTQNVKHDFAKNLTSFLDIIFTLENKKNKTGGMKTNKIKTNKIKTSKIKTNKIKTKKNNIRHKK